MDQHQLGLKVLNLSHHPHGHVQRVEQIQDLPTTTQTTPDMSDDDVLAVEISRVEIGSADKWIGFRKARQLG